MSKLKIPESWAETTLGMVSDFKNGRSFKSTEWSKSGLPIIRIQNVNATDPSTTEFNYFKGEFDQSVFVQTGDLLFCWSGSLGTSFGPRIWIGPSGVLNQHIFKVTLRECIEKRFYFWQMKANLHLVEQRAHGGVGLTHITKSELVKVPFVIPPLGEQKRIVAKIESTHEKIKTIESSISSAGELIEKYRDSILQKSFRGELIPQDPNDEPASKLIERIRAEKAKQSIGAKKKKDELPPIKPGEIPFEIPKSWEWVRITEAGEVKLGRQRAPQHHSGKHMRKYLRVANVFEERIDISDVYQMNFTPDEHETFRLKYGDILLNEGQSIELVGRPAMFRDELSDVCFTNTLVRFRANPGIDPEYALLLFITYFKTGRFRQIAKAGTNIAHLGADRFANLIIPIPPLNEQKRIVASLRRRLDGLGNITATIKSLKTTAYEMRASNLNAAFAGCFVSQDLSEGTGHELLEKIKSEQSRVAEPKTLQKTSAPSKKKRGKK